MPFISSLGGVISKTKEKSMMNRRAFIRNSIYSTSILTLPVLNSCSSSKYSNNDVIMSDKPKISLAQWSLHRHLNKGSLKAIDFAKISKNQYDIHAIEYVNQFYMEHGKDEIFWNDMKKRADNEGVKSLLIMIDDEGYLGNENDRERNTAVENHFKWVHAAKIMGCHSIRVNAFGAESEASFRSAIIDGMGQLSSYAHKEGINIIIENHGLHSSNASLIVDIIKEVDQPNFGTFPDFGNWCLNEKWGSTQAGRCDDSYDIYKGVNEFLPFARAVSAKSYDFDADGLETSMDYYQLLRNVKKSGYTGYIGVEYEGERLSEPDGIRATKQLIEKVWSSLN